MKPARIVFLVIGLLCLSRTAYLWKEQSHQFHLTWDALNLLQFIHRDQNLTEIWKDYRPFIEQGSHDEDFPCTNPYLASSGVSADIRANNHYRHALSGVALTGSPFIGLGDRDVDALTWARRNSQFDLSEEFDGGRQWEGFQRWRWTPGDIQYGNMSWENAIDRYGYSAGAKARAYYTLGFILHLLQDMGCPEHVHDDPHGASGYNGFEMWVYNNYLSGAIIEPDIRKLKPKKLPSLDTYFENLSKLGYSVNRFYGGSLSRRPPYVDPSSDLARMFNVDYSILESEWRLHNKNGQDMVWGDFAWDKDDYDKDPLWVKGHDNGEWWPTSVEMVNSGTNLRNDEEGYYYIELSGDLPKFDRERALYPDAFLPTPLPEVADQCVNWREESTRGEHLYSLIGRKILPPIIEHTAGLVEHYFEIVNHPPFVRAIEVSQRGQVQYSAIWEDNDKVKPGSETVKDVADRTFKIESDRPFMDGEVMVAIKFSEPVKNVRVTQGSRAVNGTLMEDPSVWTGRLRIDPGNMGGTTLPITIEASDRHDHYKNEGGLLDTDPGTPARRIMVLEDYQWEKYEPGKDTRHRIRTIKMQPEAAPNVPTAVKPEAKASDAPGYAFSGQIFTGGPGGTYVDQPGTASIAIDPSGNVTGSFSISFNKTLQESWESSPHARHFGSYSGAFSGKATVVQMGSYKGLTLKEVAGRGSMSDTYEPIGPKPTNLKWSKSDSAEVKVEGDYSLTAGEGKFTIHIWAEKSNPVDTWGKTFSFRVKR